MCCSREEKFSEILYTVSGSAILVQATQSHLIEIHAERYGLYYRSDDQLLAREELPPSP